MADHPAIDAIYQFKENMIRLLNQKATSKQQAKPLVKTFLDFIDSLNKIPFEACQTLAKTLSQWANEIVRMWRFTKNNGITEGFHNPNYV